MEYEQPQFDDNDDNVGGTSIAELQQRAQEQKTLKKKHHIESHLKKMDDDTTTEDEDEIKPKKKRKYKIPSWLKEPLLILILYVILSFGFIRQAIGSNIKYINPDENGEVSIIGIIIYGSIFAGLYALIKKFLLN